MRCQERKERKRIETEQMEREREIQRLIGKDRISWVGDSLVSTFLKKYTTYC